MKIIVDTCIWSLALRRRKDNITNNKAVLDLRLLIEDSRVQMLGIIRQEILSGIPVKSQFEKLEKDLSYFEDLALETSDYVLAAQFYNSCRAKGIQGSTVDFLICAAAINHQSFIFTTDKDFERYAMIIPIRLYES